MKSLFRPKLNGKDPKDVDPKIEHSAPDDRSRNAEKPKTPDPFTSFFRDMKDLFSDKKKPPETRQIAEDPVNDDRLQVPSDDSLKQNPMAKAGSQVLSAEVPDLKTEPELASLSHESVSPREENLARFKSTVSKMTVLHTLRSTVENISDEQDIEEKNRTAVTIQAISAQSQDSKVKHAWISWMNSKPASVSSSSSPSADGKESTLNSLSITSASADESSSTDPSVDASKGLCGGERSLSPDSRCSGEITPPRSYTPLALSGSFRVSDDSQVILGQSAEGFIVSRQRRVEPEDDLPVEFDGPHPEELSIFPDEEIDFASGDVAFGMWNSGSNARDCKTPPSTVHPSAGAPVVKTCSPSHALTGKSFPKGRVPSTEPKPSSKPTNNVPYTKAPCRTKLSRTVKTPAADAEDPSKKKSVPPPAVSPKINSVAETKRTKSLQQLQKTMKADEEGRRKAQCILHQSGPPKSPGSVRPITPALPKSPGSTRPITPAIPKSPGSLRPITPAMPKSPTKPLSSIAEPTARRRLISRPEEDVEFFRKEYEVAKRDLEKHKLGMKERLEAVQKDNLQLSQEKANLQRMLDELYKEKDAIVSENDSLRKHVSILHEQSEELKRVCDADSKAAFVISSLRSRLERCFEDLNSARLQNFELKEQVEDLEQSAMEAAQSWEENERSWGEKLRAEIEEKRKLQAEVAHLHELLHAEQMARSDAESEVQSVRAELALEKAKVRKYQIEYPFEPNDELPEVESLSLCSSDDCIARYCLLSTNLKHHKITSEAEREARARGENEIRILKDSNRRLHERSKVLQYDLFHVQLQLSQSEQRKASLDWLPSVPEDQQVEDDVNADLEEIDFTDPAEFRRLVERDRAEIRQLTEALKHATKTKQEAENKWQAAEQKWRECHSALDQQENAMKQFRELYMELDNVLDTPQSASSSKVNDSMYRMLNSVLEANSQVKNLKIRALEEELDKTRSMLPPTAPSPAVVMCTALE